MLKIKNIQHLAKLINMGLTLAKIALLPVLLKQSRFVRRSVVRLPEPEGLRSGIDGAGEVLRLLILGDSAAAGVGATHQNEALLGKTVKKLGSLFEVHWELIAKTGATSDSTLRYLRRISAREFDAVLISLGVNDITTNRRQKTFIAHMIAILDLLRIKFSASLIVISGLPPLEKFPSLPYPLGWYLGAQSHRFNTALKKLAEKQADCVYLKLSQTFDPSLMASDGFHPGAELYTAWSEVAAQIIKRKFAGKGS